MPSFITPLLRDASSSLLLVNRTTGQVLAARVQLAGDSASRRRGLLGRDHLDNEALILAPCTAIHTWFMRFPIDVIYVDRQGAIMKCTPHLRPWRVSGALGAFATIEMPSGTLLRSGTRQGHHLEIRAERVVDTDQI